ncbi:hypothetical protein LXL04_036616 [Taraxacum kok-saghyz]
MQLEWEKENASSVRFRLWYGFAALYLIPKLIFILVVHSRELLLSPFISPTSSHHFRRSLRRFPVIRPPAPIAAARNTSAALDSRHTDSSSVIMEVNKPPVVDVDAPPIVDVDEPPIVDVDDGDDEEEPMGLNPNPNPMGWTQEPMKP